MSENIACIRGQTKLVGRGVYRNVYKIGAFALKVNQTEEQGVKKLHAIALKTNKMNLEVRKKLDFFPKYYGAVLTSVESGGKTRPTVVSFHEYVRPGPLYSLKSFRAAIDIVGLAAKNGMMVDIKPGNFGEKGGKVYYIDESGVGKGPIPPDVLEDIAAMVDSVGPKLKTVKPKLPKIKPVKPKLPNIKVKPKFPRIIYGAPKIPKIKYSKPKLPKLKVKPKIPKLKSLRKRR